MKVTGGPRLLCANTAHLLWRTTKRFVDGILGFVICTPIATSRHFPKLPDHHMLRFPLLAILVAALSCTTAKGQGLGIGVIAGNPTGISFKKWRNEVAAIDAAAAWSFSDHGVFQLHADHLWHRDMSHAIGLGSGWTALYYGVGGRVGFSNGHHHNHTRVRVPVGLNYLFEGSPFELFAEVVPILDVAPSTELKLDAAIGVRFYIH
jgi:hypothetical protein